MKKIILQGEGREINISSLEEVVSTPEIVQELIIPAFQAMGFHPDSILDGFQEYLEQHRPVQMAEPEESHCSKCNESGKDGDFICTDCGNGIVTEVIKLRNEKTDLMDDKEGLGNLVMELRKDNEKLHKDNQRLVTENMELRVKNVPETTERVVIPPPEEEAPEEEPYQCDSCAQLFSLDDLDATHGLCDKCYSKHVCHDCGQLRDYCECELCPTCGNDHDNGAGELCDDCYMEQVAIPEDAVPEDVNGGKPAQRVNAPPPQAWSTGNPMGHYSGWATPPADDVPVEPEQEEIPEPLKCPDCASFQRDGECNLSDLGYAECIDSIDFKHFVPKFEGQEPQRGDTCRNCGDATYQEYSPISDIHGEYKCPACGDAIKWEAPPDQPVEPAPVRRSEVGSEWGSRPLTRIANVEHDITEGKTKRCPTCGVYNYPNWSICEQCGHRFLGRLEPRAHEVLRDNEGREDWCGTDSAVIPVSEPEPRFNSRSPDFECEICGEDLMVGDERYCQRCVAERSGRPRPRRRRPTRREPQRPIPQAVGVWDARQMEPSRTVPMNPKCPGCGQPMTVYRDEHFECLKCEYRTNCDCAACNDLRGSTPKGEVIEKLPPYKLSDEEKEKNLKENQERFLANQKACDEGKWHPADMRTQTPRPKMYSCGNIKDLHKNIDCKEGCGQCPVGNHNRKHGLEHGLFYCQTCDQFSDYPFPLGHCPDCGIHGRTRTDRASSKEFCHDHWDLNYPGYKAGADDN